MDSVQNQLSKKLRRTEGVVLGMEHADLDFKERVKKFFVLRTRGCGRCAGFSALFRLFLRRLPPARTACTERGCVCNPDEAPARSPAEAGAEALKLAFESLGQKQKTFCVDADPVPSLTAAQVGAFGRGEAFFF